MKEASSSGGACVSLHLAALATASGTLGGLSGHDIDSVSRALDFTEALSDRDLGDPLGRPENGVVPLVTLWMAVSAWGQAIVEDEGNLALISATVGAATTTTTSGPCDGAHVSSSERGVLIGRCIRATARLAHQLLSLEAAPEVRGYETSPRGQGTSACFVCLLPHGLARAFV